MFKKKNKIKENPTQNENAKIPFYKKAWFKIIAGIIVFSVVIDPFIPDKYKQEQPPVKETEKVESTETTETELTIQVTDEDMTLYQSIEDEYNRLFDLAMAEMAEGELLTADDDERLWEEAMNNVANVKGLSIEQVKAFFDEKASDVIAKQIQDQKDYMDTTKEFEEASGFIKSVAKKFAENQEMKKLKFGVLDSNLSHKIYSDKPIHDQAGNEFKYSYLVGGQFEDKQGNLGNSVMVVGFDSIEQVKNLEGYLLLYVCQETGTYFNVLADADNQFLE